MAQREELRQRLTGGLIARRQELYQCCLSALDHELFEEIEAAIRPMTVGEGKNDARAWQILGLALRGLQDSDLAHAAFCRAESLTPDDALIAHSIARTALEAGYPAADFFKRARVLAPRDSTVILGAAAALLGEGREREACATLQAILDDSPGWIEGHKAFARIAAMIGAETDREASLRVALASYPSDEALWACLVELAMQADDYQRGLDHITQAKRVLGENLELAFAEAVCLNETGQPEAASDLFSRFGASGVPRMVPHLVRNLIRLRRFREAAALIEPRYPSAGETELWPYRAMVWRILDDPRWEWLEGDPRLIREYDLTSALGSLSGLAAMLTAIHLGTGQPIDQSVRGGTQTDGDLFARAEPEIRLLRSAVLDAVRDYAGQLPRAVAGHPTLLRFREPIRVKGSWSVRLLGQGYHVDHVHPQGWLSSAFYAALPEGSGGIGNSGVSENGWLKFGECEALVPDLAAFRVIEPKAGKLVLFPSTMWHGTRRFKAGERITVAFDIARPRQK